MRLSEVAGQSVVEYERCAEAELAGGSRLQLCQYAHPASEVTGILDTEFPGARRVDAMDLEFVDVAGIRALRGPDHEPLTIAAASPAVRRIVSLLGWDTDPAVQVVA